MTTTTTEKNWLPCPIDMSFLDLSGDNLKKQWAAMHLGNLEPFPENEEVQQAWRHYHLGEFGQAIELADSLGEEGLVVAALSRIIYAQYVVADKDNKIKLFKEVMATCEKATEKGLNAKQFNIHYAYAVAMGRYSQFVSMVEALQQGYGGKIKEQVTTLVEKQPAHAEGLVTYAGWHAAISDQAGAMMAKMLYGATKDDALSLYEKAKITAPESTVVYIENADGLDVIFGKAKNNEIKALIEQALTLTPKDAMQYLDVAKAKAKLADL